jgi:protein gp37
MARRLQAMGVVGYEEGFRLSLHPARIDQPLRRRKPTVFFVNSMSDLFHEGIPDEFLDRVLDVIARTPQHTYQILTKRAERLPIYFANRAIPKNVWLGVSVENKQTGLPRIEYLREIDSSIRFLSCEPLLEDLGAMDLRGIHWVIVGGESGPQARPMQPEWVENIRKRCELFDAAFFFKQWGGWGADGVKRNKKANGRTYLGRTWNEQPAITLAQGSA